MPDDAPTDPRAAVLDAVDRLAPRLVETTSAAVRIASVDPRYPGQDYDSLVGREAEVSRLMADVYRSAGADVEMVVVEAGRDNACGRIRGTGGGRSLVFNGHVDVVPTNPSRWSRDPFSGLITDTAVHGRGASDDKGGVVAAGFAALALAEAGVRLRGDLVLQAVVGEEVGDHTIGTTAAVQAGYGADAALIVEPTNYDDAAPRLATVSSGGLWFSLTLTGKIAHSSLYGYVAQPALQGTSLGVNVIDRYWVIYRALQDLQQRWARDDRHPLYRDGHFSILPGVLEAHPHGFRVPFGVPDELTVEYCVTHNPARSNEEVIAEIEGVVRDACANDSWLREHEPVFEWKLLWPPYTTPGDLDLLPALAAAHSRAVGDPSGATGPGLEGFFGLCDITWMEAQQIPGVVYGPGNALTAHAEDEYVAIDQLVTAAKTYALTAIEYCGVAQD
ncbi:M20/M25/M40 family metallo-hydrolase [Nakamurella endophytica]|uniref:Acetylornithine deacetylase n=1 Tax=Nakamurella endophytica TaxID=1748367 RepID=A0A917WFT2_9ACTN|nr:M20/M25/M40 family metallo-hydrolase [Nakamurella endophytica]GGL99091.1 acetylornithine deacetylase [Nakamurella endophytica]